MPQLGQYQFLLRCVVFIYPTRSDAEAGQKFGGSGFLVTYPSADDPEGFHHGYVVTNLHVAKGERRAIRVNLLVGGFEVVEVDDWFFDPNGPDIAVAPIALDVQRHAVDGLLATSWLLTEERCRELEIDAGDDTFMIGRFVDYDGVETNKPSLRFGNISIATAEVKQSTGYTGASFVVDTHSRTGYSGSPVFVYRTHGSIFPAANTIVGGGHTLLLLGVHWGQFPEVWELEEITAPRSEAAEESLITDGKYVRGLSGMTCVVPSWDLLQLLESKPVADHRRAVEEYRAANP